MPFSTALRIAIIAMSVLPLAVGVVTSILSYSNIPLFTAISCGGYRDEYPSCEMSSLTAPSVMAADTFTNTASRLF